MFSVNKVSVYLFIYSTLLLDYNILKLVYVRVRDRVLKKKILIEKKTYHAIIRRILNFVPKSYACLEK